MRITMKPSPPNSDPGAESRSSLLRRRDGVVIVAVLWICALIMWFALRISAESRLRGDEQVHQLRRSQALYLAIGGCYEAIARMGQGPTAGFDKSETEDWLPDGIPRIVNYQTGQAVVVVEPESTKVNVNKASAQELRLVFERAGMQDGDAERLAAAISDFIDRDDIPQLHGAERDQYQQLGLPYGPFNGPLSSLDQLLLIPGVSQQLFYGQGRIFGDEDDKQQSGVRIASFPSNNSLFQMLTIYGNSKALPDAELDLESDPKRIAWEPSGIYRILSRGVTTSGPPAVVMWLVVRNAPDSEKGYEVLYRKVL